MIDCHIKGLSFSSIHKLRANSFMKSIIELITMVFQLFRSYLPKMYKRALLLLMLTLFTLVFPSQGRTEGEVNLDKVTIQLKWFHQFQFAGYYAAVHKGFFLEEGLDVDLKEGGPNIHVDDEVVSGRANFGVLASELIQKRAEGKPITLLAVIFQHSLRAIIVRKKSSIHSPSDFIGKTLMINLNEDIEFQSMFRDEGIPYNNINIIPKDNSANQKFLNGEIDGLNGSIGNQPFIFQEKGIPVTTIRPISYGTDFYGDSLFTSDKQVGEHPERVKKIIRASIRGWYYAMNNSEEIADLILKEYAQKKNREHLLYEAESIRKLILPDLVDIGHVNPNRIKRIAHIYREHGLIRDNYSLDGLLYSPDSVNPRFKQIISFLSFLVLVVFLLGGILFFINLRLKKLVHRRTLDLQKSNLLFNTIIETTTDAIFIKDLQGRYILANDATLKALGKTKPETIGKSDTELFPEVSAKAIYESDSKVMEAGVAMLSEERLETAHGDTYWLSNKAPYRDHANRIIGLIGISRNISELKKSEDEKRILIEQLHQSQKMESIGTLAGGIAHEFNNMLAIIMGNNELIMEELPQGGLARESTEEIRIAGLRARDVVKQLLSFSRQDDAVKKVMDFTSIVQESIKFIRSSIPANIKIEQNLSVDTCPVIGNNTEINQLLINLCNNAVDALPEKEGVITIELLTEIIDEQQNNYQNKLKPGQYAKLMVSDNGIGMDTDILDRVFEPYFTTKDIGEGTGIGMAVCHGIVERHGGEIIADSKPDQGTTFTVFLPVHEGLFERDTDEVDILPVGDEYILYVDDEPSIAILAKRLLEGLGYTTESTTDPQKALDMVRNDPQKFDLLITDMAMPNMTGDQLVIEILKIRQDMPTIMCTGYSSTISEKEAADIGVSSYIMKPINKSELATTVRKALDSAKRSNFVDP